MGVSCKIQMAIIGYEKALHLRPENKHVKSQVAKVKIIVK